MTNIFCEYHTQTTFVSRTKNLVAFSVCVGDVSSPVIPCAPRKIQFFPDSSRHFQIYPDFTLWKNIISLEKFRRVEGKHDRGSQFDFKSGLEQGFEALGLRLKLAFGTQPIYQCTMLFMNQKQSEVKGPRSDCAGGKYRGVF